MTDRYASQVERKYDTGGENGSPTGATGLFFRRFLAQPGKVASLIPSSPAFSRTIARQIRREPDEYVVELGAGTGSVTRAILDAGVPPEKLVLVEIDPEMADFLRHAHPKATVVEGSCFDLAEALPEAVPEAAGGKVGSIVCGVPIALFEPGEQRRLADTMISLMPHGRPFLALTYRWNSPLPHRELDLEGARLGFTPWNVPPASVWGYRRNGHAAGRANGHDPVA